MNKQTRESLQDLAAVLDLLTQCEMRLTRIPKRFPGLYVYIPAALSDSLRAARLGTEEFARQLAEYQHLPLSCADLKSKKKSH